MHYGPGDALRGHGAELRSIFQFSRAQPSRFAPTSTIAPFEFPLDWQGAQPFFCLDYASEDALRGQGAGLGAFLPSNPPQPSRCAPALAIALSVFRFEREGAQLFSCLDYGPGDTLRGRGAELRCVFSPIAAGLILVGKQSPLYTWWGSSSSVERSLSMREVQGSTPWSSKRSFFWVLPFCGPGGTFGAVGRFSFGVCSPDIQSMVCAVS